MRQIYRRLFKINMKFVHCVRLPITSLLVSKMLGLMWMLVVACFISSSTYCFNFETRLPVIKLGAENSYFGFSVAEHQSLRENGQVEHSWILVGAPRGKNMQPNTNKSGALFKCPLSTKIDDCDQVTTDGRRQVSDDRYNASHIFDADSINLYKPGDDEIKDDQWLGVTVRSQGPGGKVLVCAHRYIEKGDSYQWGRGLCYTLKSALEYDNVWDPCKRKPVERAHEDYGFCQAGTSGYIFDDTAIIGSPGPMTWTGMIFAVGISDDYFARDKITYNSPVNDNVAPVKKYSYLGMSVTAGHFYGENITSYAAGAPRGGNETGQVILFTKHTGDNLLEVKLIIDGEQFASSFGYEVATADVNGDKRPDLIVAAPFYFSRDVGGAVYVYLNSIDHCFTCKPPLKLTGKPESRFGFAITNIGDINKDGYDDIAIGAPYEGNGTVYIYLGAADGLMPEPSQIIRSNDITSPKSITTFGYSLSGGIDLDLNGYPDLAIGAYEQDLVVLLRTRPIIGLTITYGPETNLRNIDPNQPGCSENKTSPYTCFSFETCCTIESIIKSQSSGKLQLKYRIEAETFKYNQKFSRIWFNTSLTNSTNINEQIISIGKGDSKHCQKHIAYLKKNIRDIQSPIHIKISYALVDQHSVILPRPGDPLPSLENLPILNQQQADKIFQASFHNDCGGDICHSQLKTVEKLSLPYSDKSQMYELVLGEVTDLQMNVTVINNGESAYEAKLYITCPSSITYVSSVTSSSEVCELHDNVIICSLGNPLRNKNLVHVSLHFDLSKLDDSIHKTEFIIITNSTSVDENAERNNFTVPVAVLKKTLLSVIGSSTPDSEFELEAGTIKGESDIHSLAEIGPEILHVYTIYNTGTWHITNLEIHIEWPYQVYNNGREGKWLLYLTDEPDIDGAFGKCEVNPSDINPVKFPRTRLPVYPEQPFQSGSVKSKHLDIEKQYNSSSDAIYNRVRRSAHYIVQPEVYKNKNGRKEKLVHMNCILTTARCIIMVCKIYKIPKSEAAKITIKSRLWNSTLLQDYSNIDLIKVTSRAKIHNEPSLPMNEFHVQTVIRVNVLGQQSSESVPLFIIIAAVVVGLLIFILLTICMYKLGFFKRRRPNALLSGNVKKQDYDY